ncbi:MAG: hypothetical protein C0392_11095 [Syntrophus sp. (in: bacteria)]|nr:hypothetical protein [Syntrophus sp. (in: bacteria)]
MWLPHSLLWGIIRIEGKDMDQPPLAIYVERRTLSGLAGHPSQGASDVQGEVAALRRIWKLYKKKKILLITSRKDMETDIILWLNRQGCCVTDTLVVMEAIKEFGEWSGADKKILESHKRLVHYFDEIEVLPAPYDGSITMDPLFTLIIEKVLGITEKESSSPHPMEEERKMLSECARDLHLWYTGDGWKNLRRTDYKLNWDLLSSMFTRQGGKTAYAGKEGERNLALFGLLNRSIGLIKKSCPALPVPDIHINFIIDMVLKKYHYLQEERDALHILLCIRNRIPFLMTTDQDLIMRFNERRDVLKDLPDLSSAMPELVSPKTLEERIRASILTATPGV